MPEFPRSRFARALLSGLAATLALGASALVAPGVAAAASSSAAGSGALTVGITPVGTAASYFTVTMAPGTSRQLAVNISNHSNSPAQASTYAADVYTVVNGGFGARLSNQPASGVTEWLSYPTATLNLTPGGVLQRAFTVSVPRTAAAGEHITSLVVQSQQKLAGGGEPVSLNQVSRDALPIIVDVPGPRTSGLVIGTASAATLDGHSVISVGVSNPGNVRIDPVGRLTVDNPQGVQVTAVDIKMGTVYPLDATTVRDTNATILPAGAYTVTLALGEPSLGLATQTRQVELEVAAPAGAQIPAGTPTPIVRLAAARPRSGLSTELLVGLILGAVLFGGFGTYGFTAWRRRDQHGTDAT